MEEHRKLEDTGELREFNDPLLIYSSELNIEPEALNICPENIILLT